MPDTAQAVLPNRAVFPDAVAIGALVNLLVDDKRSVAFFA
jgi:hypothetical protein